MRTGARVELHAAVGDPVDAAGAAGAAPERARRVVNLTSMAVKEINDGLLLSNALRPGGDGLGEASLA